MTRYRTIVADPPWPMEWSTPSTRVNGRGERHKAGKRDLGYRTMEIDEIAALPVSDLAEDDAHLYLWITESLLIDGFAPVIAVSWGFTVKRTLVWRKSGFGLGSFPRPQHETCLICTRGSLPFQRKDVGSVQDWKLVYEKAGQSVARKHSAKPDGFYDLIESASPGPRLELFSRRARFGWDTHGFESLGHVELTL